MNNCECGAGILNMGSPACSETLGVARRPVFVNLYANDGTKNRITLASAFGSAEYTALVNQADKSKRWYPGPKIDTVDMPKAEPNYVTLESDEKRFVSEGLRSFKAIVAGGSAKMMGQLNGIRCVEEVGMYVLDLQGGLSGEVSADGLYLEPYRIMTGGFNAMLELAKNKTEQNINIAFDFSRENNEANWATLNSTDLGFTTILDIDGLLDVIATVSNESTTGFKVKLELIYGRAKTKIAVTGLLITDFKSFSTAVAEKVRNVTDSADIAITSVTETPNGTYEFVYAAQTSADVIKVDLIKNSYEQTTITVTTP